MQRETTFAIAADHPAFAGHFPGMPIVPGVVLLDEALVVMQAEDGLAPDQCRIASAKFFHPVGPGTSLVLRRETLANGSIRFDIEDGSRKIATGTLSPVRDGAPG